MSQGPRERREASPRRLHETAQFLTLHDLFGLSQFVMSLCNLPVNQRDQGAAYQGRVEEQAASWEGIVLTLTLFRTAGE